MLVKHFELALDTTNPDARRRLETRVLLHELTGWAGYTYRWNDAQTDAELLTGRVDEVFSIVDPQASGGMRDQTWTYPSRTDCLQCHQAPSGRVLGVRTAQLNGDFDYPAATDNQLRSWNNIGLFTTDVGPAANLPAWPDPLGSASLASRARSYLAANCANCHQPGAQVPTPIDLRFGTLLGDMGIVDERPQDDLGLSNPWIVRPGNKDASTLWHRMGRTDNSRMPRIGSNEVHDPGVALIGAWIDALR